MGKKSGGDRSYRPQDHVLVLLPNGKRRMVHGEAARKLLQEPK